MKELYIIGYGLGGGFGGIQDYEVIKALSEEEANEEAYLKSCEEYGNYPGMHGLRDIEEIMEEDEVDEDTAYEIYLEEREDWLDYVAIPYSDEKEKELSVYHFYNPFKTEKE